MRTGVFRLLATSARHFKISRTTPGAAAAIKRLGPVQDDFRAYFPNTPQSAIGTPSFDSIAATALAPFSPGNRLLILDPQRLTNPSVQPVNFETVVCKPCFANAYYFIKYSFSVRQNPCPALSCHDLTETYRYDILPVNL
jgi:hypothetical protein